MIYPGYSSNKNSEPVIGPSLKWQPKTTNEQKLAANVLKVKTFESTIKEIALKLPSLSNPTTTKDTFGKHTLERNAPTIIKTDTHEEHPLKNASNVDTHGEHKLERNAPNVIKSDTHEEHPLKNASNVETHENNELPETSEGHKIVRGIVDLKDRVTTLNLNKDDIPLFIKEHTIEAALKDLDTLGDLSKPLPKIPNPLPSSIKQSAIKDESPEIAKNEAHPEDIDALKADFDAIRAELEELKKIRSEDLSDFDLSDMDDYPEVNSMDKKIEKNETNLGHHIHSGHHHHIHSELDDAEDLSEPSIEFGSNLEDLKNQLAQLEAKLAAENQALANQRAIFDSHLSKPSPIPTANDNQPAAANQPLQPAETSQIKPNPHQAELDRLDAEKPARIYNPRIYNHGIVNDPEKLKTLLRNTEIREKENGAALFCYSEHGMPMMYVKNRDGNILEKPLNSITKNEIKYCLDNNIRLVKPLPSIPKTNVEKEATTDKVKQSALTKFLSNFTTRRSFSWKAFRIG